MKKIEIIYMILSVCIGGLIGFSLALSYSNFWDNNINKIVINDNQDIRNLYTEFDKCNIEKKDYIVLTYQTIDSFQEKGFYCTVNRCLADGYCKEERLKLNIQ